MTAVDSTSALRPGVTIAERYRVHREIGSGGMGRVVEVEHLGLGRRFALKLLRVEHVEDELVQRFNREARALARVASPRVAQVTDFGVEPQLGPFYVMELLQGETLERRIFRDGPLPADQAAAIALEVAEALAEIHQTGIVHRDLKPSNVGLCASGPVPVKLLDFGLAASVDDSYLERITRSQQVLGSLPYMAPEQFHGARPAPAMDLWALGVLLFEALTGRLPFTADSTAALIHQILSAPLPSIRHLLPERPLPAKLESTVHRLLTKDPEARFASAAQAADALRRVLGGEAAAGVGLDTSATGTGAASPPPRGGTRTGTATPVPQSRATAASDPASGPVRATGPATDPSGPVATEPARQAGPPASTRAPSRRALLLGSGLALATASVVAMAVAFSDLGRAGDDGATAAAEVAGPRSSATPAAKAPDAGAAAAADAGRRLAATAGPASDAAEPADPEGEPPARAAPEQRRRPAGPRREAVEVRRRTERRSTGGSSRPSAGDDAAARGQGTEPAWGGEVIPLQPGDSDGETDVEGKWTGQPIAAPE